jgi:hypothetical protein
MILWHFYGRFRGNRPLQGLVCRGLYDRYSDRRKANKSARQLIRAHIDASHLHLYLQRVNPRLVHSEQVLGRRQKFSPTQARIIGEWPPRGNPRSPPVMIALAFALTFNQAVLE